VCMMRVCVSARVHARTLMCAQSRNIKIRKRQRFVELTDEHLQAF